MALLRVALVRALCKTNSRRSRGVSRMLALTREWRVVSTLEAMGEERTRNSHLSRFGHTHDSWAREAQRLPIPSSKLAVVEALGVDSDELTLPLACRTSDSFMVCVIHHIRWSDSLGNLAPPVIGLEEQASPGS